MRLIAIGGQLIQSGRSLEATVSGFIWLELQPRRLHCRGTDSKRINMTRIACMPRTPRCGNRLLQVPVLVG